MVSTVWKKKQTNKQKQQSNRRDQSAMEISHTTQNWECCQRCRILIDGLNRQEFKVICCRYLGFLLEGTLVLVDRLPLLSAVSSSVSHPRADPRAGTEVREQRRATTERALPITLKGRFWAAVAAVCSPSFHLSISFSAPVLSSGQSRPEVKIQWLIYSRQQAANPQQCLCNIELLQLLFHSFPQKAIRFLLLFSQTLVESVYAHLCLFSAAILPTFGDTVTNGSGEMQ